MKKNKSTNAFLASSLPHNRKQQFFDILKHRYMLLILNGFFLLLGCALLIFLYSMIVNLSDTNNFMEFIKNQGISEDLYGFSYFWMINFSYLILIPFFVLSFMFLGGSLRIIRLLAWDEGVFFFHDFFNGIKKNWKQSLIAGIFVSVYIFLGKFIGGALTLYVSGDIGIGFEIFTKSIFILFLFPITINYLILSNYFENNFVNSIKNAFKVFSNNIVLHVVLSFLMLIVYIIPMIGNKYLIIIAIFVIALFIAPIYLLIWNQSILKTVDMHNQNDEIKNKGLYKALNH